MDNHSPISDLDFRDIAKKSLKKKRDAWQFLIVTIAVNSGLSIVWAVNGGGSFWPGWVIFGMGLGVVISFLDAYNHSFRSRSEISESDIDLEIERLKKNGKI